MLELQNICKAYSSSNFKLENINFKVHENEIVGLIGENGTGKSTILKMINHLVPMDHGTIYFNGERITSKLLRNFRSKVVYIFQSGNLLDKKTVLCHLKLVYKLQKKPVNMTEINQWVTFFGLQNVLKTQVYYLSGGQKQKLAIAMALISKPQILLCDEISSQLDVGSEKEIFELLQQIKSQLNISMVIVSHNLEILKNFCDRVLLIDQHTIAKEIIPNKKSGNVIGEYAQFVERYLYD